MTDHSAEFRRCLSECDIVAIRKLSSYVFPDAPQPLNDQEALATIHYARTQSVWLDLRSRAYSHSWLLDHDLPSALPDELKPRAERMYPRVVEGVGIAVKVSSDWLRPVAKIIHKAMTNAVMEAYTDRRTESWFIKTRIMEARSNAVKTLLGKVAKN